MLWRLQILSDVLFLCKSFRKWCVWTRTRARVCVACGPGSGVTGCSQKTLRCSPSRDQLKESSPRIQWGQASQPPPPQ